MLAVSLDFMYWIIAKLALFYGASENSLNMPRPPFQRSRATRAYQLPQKISNYLNPVSYLTFSAIAVLIY